MDVSQLTPEQIAARVGRVSVAAVEGALGLQALPRLAAPEGGPPAKPFVLPEGYRPRTPLPDRPLAPAKRITLACGRQVAAPWRDVIPSAADERLAVMIEPRKVFSVAISGASSAALAVVQGASAGRPDGRVAARRRVS